MFPGRQFTLDANDIPIHTIKTNSRMAGHVVIPRLKGQKVIQPLSEQTSSVCFQEAATSSPLNRAFPWPHRCFAAM